MKYSELKENKELAKEIEKAITDEITKGTNRIDATVNALKKYDIEFNENEVRGKLISMQELDENQMDQVNAAGGTWCLEDEWCLTLNRCDSFMFSWGY